jgi:histone H3/H4
MMTPEYNHAIDEAVAAFAAACLPCDEVTAKLRMQRSNEALLHAVDIAGGRYGDKVHRKVLLEVQELIFDRLMTRASEKLVPDISAELGADAGRIVEELTMDIFRDALAMCHEQVRTFGRFE